jgi:XTP/dITP diphosphohydrolase
MPICFATNNHHKINEVRALLGEPFRLLTLQEVGCYEELPEEQNTLEGNSFQKADYVFSTYKIPCFADDSGLEVETLGGAPGVHSAYYSGTRDADANIALVLKNLEGKENRKARFRTIITLITEHEHHSFEGEIMGTILSEKRGNNGFGYDPIFMPDGYPITFAEMTNQQKNEVSHRAIAISRLVQFLKMTKFDLSAT